MCILYSNTMHITGLHTAGPRPSIRPAAPAAAQLRAALEAPEEREGSTELHHDDGALVVHLAARVDEAHAAAAVAGAAAAAADHLPKHLELLWRLRVPKS